MKKPLVAIFLLVAMVVFAKPHLYTNSFASGTTAAILEPSLNVRDWEVFAPDEDVTVSFWRHNADDSYTKMYPKEPANCANCDSVYVVYAGIPRKFEKMADADLAYIARATATAVDVSAK